MKEIINEIKNLRNRLHQIPELSFEEVKTKAMLMEELKEKTCLDVVDQGKWFYAKWDGTDQEEKEKEGSKEAIAFRADYDAVAGKDGEAGHYCGHDGHAAALVGLAHLISLRKPRRKVYLIFQPAEEIGQGASLCKSLIGQAGIKEIYGFHNIPGFPQKSILILPGTFACASTGLEIAIEGQPSHAAYPEAGKNPAQIMAKMVLYNEELLKRKYEGMVLGTVIGINLGSDSYGVSASRGILRMTFRAEKSKDFHDIIDNFLEYGKKLAQEEGMDFTYRKIEEFPATENHLSSIKKVEASAKELGLALAYPEVPFRWSEDFGYYLKECEGAFFGIGSGKEWPQLHTQNYDFPDEIIESAMTMFWKLIEK